MKTSIKKIISNKLYIGCLIVVFIQYIIRNNYVKEALFGTTNISSVSQYILLILAILGATMLAGTILFLFLFVYILVFKKFMIPIWKRLFNIDKK